jgi:hypothetical protein
MKEAQHSSETPSIPAHLVLASAANATVHMEDGEAVTEERRVVAMPQVQQAKQQESREVIQTDLEGQVSGAGAKEL